MSLPKKLPEFHRASVLVLGDVMLDRYWFGDTARISPEAPVPVVNIKSIDNRPGGAGNVALNIAALGAKATLLGITGQDEAAALLESQLAAANVGHDLTKSNAQPTIVKLRVISRHQQLLRLDFEEKIINQQQDNILSALRRHINQHTLVILSDYKKGTLADPQAYIQLARKAGVPVLVDPKGDDFSIYQDADIITPNFKEFETIVGRCENEQAILNKGRELLKKYRFGALLITRGEHGMTLIQPETTAHLPAYAREVFDVTGAGDTVIGTLGAALAAGANILSAVTLANLAASISVNKLGAATVTPPELEASLCGHNKLTSGIVNDEQLLLAVNQVRAQGKKVVFTNGCFDILHAGHVNYLQHAKQLGDYLIVAVNSDESVRKLKGTNRPINNLEHRLTVLAGLGVVDWVVPFTDDTPERLLRLLQPDMLVKGGDYQINQVVGADIVRAYGGDVRVINQYFNTSSSAIIQQIQTLAYE